MKAERVNLTRIIIGKMKVHVLTKIDGEKSLKKKKLSKKKYARRRHCWVGKFNLKKIHFYYFFFLRKEKCIKFKKSFLAYGQVGYKGKTL